MGAETKVHIVTNWLQCLCWFKLVKKTTISNIQSLLTSGTTHTSKYGIFRFENTAEALGGADGETNLQDSGDDHSDSGHFCRQSGACVCIGNNESRSAADPSKRLVHMDTPGCCAAQRPLWQSVGYAAKPRLPQARKGTF